MYSTTLRTRRLLLRPFQPRDANELTELCGEREIASYTLLIPHPYTLEDASAWIAGRREASARGEAVDFAVTLLGEGTLVGSVGLRIESDHERAEMGYWIGKPFWNRGYASEAAKAALDYGFDALRLNRVYAHHMAGNPASGEVLLKVGMRYEGRVRQHVKKWGHFEDLLLYGLLRSDRCTSHTHG